MTFLLETTVPLLALIGTGFVSAGLVMLLMTLGMPDEKKQEDNYDPFYSDPIKYMEENLKYLHAKAKYDEK